MDDEEEGALVIAQRFALQAEQYAAKGQYTKAIDRHSRAARHFQLCIGQTSDRAANEAVALLLAAQLAAIEHIRKRLYGPAVAVAAAPSAAIIAPASAPAAAAGGPAAAAAGLTASVTSSLVLGTPPKAPAASPAPPPPVSLDATAGPDTASAAHTSANAKASTSTSTSSGMSLALDSARTLQLRRALDALVLAAATDDQSASLDAVRNADALKAFGAELRTRLSAEEDALSRALHTPLLRTAGAGTGAGAPASTPVPGAAAAALTPSAGDSSSGSGDAAQDMAAMAAALSALRAQVFQLSVSEKAAALENAVLKQRVAAFQQRTKESQRLLYGALTGPGATTPAPGAAAAGSVLCGSDVCGAEKKKLRDRLAAVSAELSSETALRQKQSALLDTYQTKLKRYEEKWDKLKAQAHASVSAKRASLTSPAATPGSTTSAGSGAGAPIDPAAAAAAAAAAVGRAAAAPAAGR